MYDSTPISPSTVPPTPPSQPSTPQTNSSPLIDSARAVRLAFEYLMRVSANAERYQHYRVEEVQTDEHDDYLVTLSYDFVGEFPFDRKREYKDFKVEKTGNVVWMKIRKI